jgi:pseudaminic acid cytidylyltransferase
MCIALITARIGSKRIKKKNIKIFFGKPIISYPISVCKKIKFFKNIYVSTESKTISKIVKKYEAQVPFLRPKNLADSKTGTLPVVKDFIRKLKIPYNTVVCCIYPVTPMLTAQLLKKSYRTFKKSSSKFLIPVIRTNEYNSKSFQLNKNNVITKNNSDKNYLDAGQFYLGKARDFLRTKSLLFSGSSKALIIKSNEAIDVNTNKDWKKLKLLFRKQNKNVKI